MNSIATPTEAVEAAGNEPTTTERDRLARVLYMRAEWHWRDPDPAERWEQELPEYREQYARMADAALEAGYTRTSK